MTDMAEFEAALPVLRPQIHRYAARMAGSVIEGEDILQEVLLRATTALQSGAKVDNLRAWLFRIAHNTAINQFRAQKSENDMKRELSNVAELDHIMPRQSALPDALRPYLSLTPLQRSAVLMRDVLGYTAAEVADLTDQSVSSVKSALHRGRAALRSDPDLAPVIYAPLSDDEKARLSHYATCFNAHEFDRLRDILAAEVRLELVDRETRVGKAGVGNYYGNYSVRDDWLMAPGRVEGRPAILAFDRENPSDPPIYFILLTFASNSLHFIRDFRYARYVMEGVTWERLSPEPHPPIRRSSNG